MANDTSLPLLVRTETTGEDEATRLKGLATEVRDQDDLERDISRQADKLLNEQADERDLKRLDKTHVEREKLQKQVRGLRERLGRQGGSATATRLNAEIQRLDISISTLTTDIEQIEERIEQRQTKGDGQDVTLIPKEAGNRRLPNESQRDFLLRTGKITPFSKMPGRSLNRSDSTLQGVLLDAEEEPEIESDAEELPAAEGLSHRNLVQPGFTNDHLSDSMTEELDTTRPKKRRRLHRRSSLDGQTSRDKKGETTSGQAIKEAMTSEEDDTNSALNTSNHDSVASDESGESEYEEDDMTLSKTTSPHATGKSRNRDRHDETKKVDLNGLDDGNERLYQNRLSTWIERRRVARTKASSGKDPAIDSDIVLDTKYTADEDASPKEWHLPHPVAPDVAFDGGYRIPGDIYPSLFDYQKTGVQWLWELYSQRVGGIVGDEMGLGKTIQVIAFLAGLHYSKKITKPVLVVAPATVMKQWVNEFHTWWPPFRVSILHTSGSGMIDVSRESRVEDELLSELPSSDRRKPITKSQKAAKRIVDRVVQEGHILVTTYSGLQTYAELLLPLEWEYAVLDEGHKIRNPNTAITIYCKELRTADRIILSGTPMQNNLIELWSLFDFIFPMRLGTLVNFRQQFEFPIRQGGYANASNLQVQTAMKCAEILKDTISPYLLQRFKSDVASDLPKKSEQVLLCRLTKFQRETYENFLASDDMKSILNGRRQILYGVDILRKICNHPDLQEHRELSVKAGYDYGNGAKSGKMQVVKALLELWKETGHKTLLFAQHRIMLDILEKFIRSLGGFNLRRMDGTTPIQSRQGLVDEFNTNANAHVFLLTTKVGGLGINLTGADRVIIYDPDWNPSTDVQAKERAWRLGQKREVVIYRLMTAGTIEEKIYHRQLFKHFLINKILKDPKQRQTFQMKHLHDLFTLGGVNDLATETSEMFKGNEVRFDSSSTMPEQVVEKGIMKEDMKQDMNNNSDNASSVRNLTGVVSLEQFHDGEEKEREAAPKDATNSEALVMEGIFARSGVHAALEHDQIINGKKVVSADPSIIEAEAKRVAAEAGKELKKAGEAARNIPAGIPTWTGQYGTAGRPEQQQRGLGRGRGGPSSMSILGGLQNRQNTGVTANVSRSDTPSRNAGPQSPDFIRMIRDYLITHGGQVHTQMLIDHFNRFCDTPQKTIQFKATLTEIATLEKAGRGRGRWVLKSEYKSRV